MSENNADGTVETTKTAEEYKESLRKAEAKIVELKKSNATAEDKPKGEDLKPEPEVNTATQDFDKLYEERKFFENNPDFVESKDAILGYTSKGISYDEAKILVERNDPTYIARQKSKQSNFTSGDEPIGDSYTMEQLAQI